MARVLVVEDEASIRRMVVFALRQAGYEVATAEDGRGALDEVERIRPDAMVLDVLLPGLDGFEVCRRIRLTSDLPILMLTALAQEDDVIRGLQLGADDYLTKPFSIRVLLARVSALLRRSGREESDTVTVRDLTIDFGRCEVWARGTKVDLTPTEFKLLGCLARNTGRVVTSRALLREAGDYDAENREAQEIVKVHIRHLRSKLEPDPDAPQYILNVRGFGYLLDSQGPSASPPSTAP